MADVDGDHVVDLINTPPGYPYEAGVGTQDAISVWKGLGDGTFAATPIVTTFSEPIGFANVSIADFDGDGRADASINTSSSPSINISPSQTFAFGQSDDTFLMGASLTAPTAMEGGYGIGPFAGPGSWELFYTGLTPGTAAYSIVTVKGPPNSSATYVGPTALNLSVGSSGYAQFIGSGDVYGDGQVEVGLFGGASNSSWLEVLSWMGTGGVQPTMTEITVNPFTAPPFPAHDFIGDAQMVDLDGDGLADFFVEPAVVPVNPGYLSDSTPLCAFLWNDGGGTFTPATGIPCMFPAWFVGDFNGDGISDILYYAGGGGQPSYIVFGDGARGFGGRLDLPLFLEPPLWAVDVNNDGVLDLVEVNSGGGVGITYVYISTARTPAPAQPDIHCDAASLKILDSVDLGSLCAPPARF